MGPNAPLYARYVPPTQTATEEPKLTVNTEDPVTQSEPKSRSHDRSKKRKKGRDESKDADEPSNKHRKLLSKFQKSTSLANVSKATPQPDPPEKEAARTSPELHGLTALPQPAPIQDAPYQPNFATLPTWLANPISVSSKAIAPFDSFVIDEKIKANLHRKGYNDALAIQAAILPLLLPGSDQALGDLCVSASTGSGKTLAYMVPIIQSLKTRITKLRALVVVPTRELALQQREVAESCANGTNVRIGVAIGSRSLEEEQEQLIKADRRFCPGTHDELQRKANERLRDGTSERDPVLEDAVMMLPGHVRHYESNVDILICTPGRLVDHLHNTRGFNLDDVEWLILDEADRLLDQSFQQWIQAVMGVLERQKPFEELSALERISAITMYPTPTRRVKKVVLSATMTRDLEQLSALKLHRPTLVVLDDTTSTQSDPQVLGSNNTVPGTSGEVFQIPSTLIERAIPVGDGADKPLYLLLLLISKISIKGVSGRNGGATTTVSKKVRDDREVSASTESSSDEDSSESPVLSSSDDRDQSVSSRSNNSFTNGRNSRSKDGRTKEPRTETEKDPVNQRGVLIFTKTNENATRLSHLLNLLHPPLEKSLGTLTKSSTSSERRKILSGFRNGRTSILIASDRASRGLDIPALAHIVNYDMPSSLTAYIHRIGRTARAGNEGQAWTLFTDTEARWFWNAIARAPEVKRGSRSVQRMKMSLDEVQDVTKDRYNEALKKLQDAVQNT